MSNGIRSLWKDEDWWAVWFGFILIAASLTGLRSMCSMKHLGLCYAGDPISTMPYVGVEGGLVIVSL